jgi:glycosidase
VNPDLGGDRAMANLLTRLHARGLRLMLDFIPNHTARDHPWLTLHPDFYIQGNEEDFLSQPFNYGTATHTDRIFAFGRDPYFPGWTDTFQLDYSNPQLQTAMIDELSNIAALCDGVRCDMAMLILPEVFSHTWGLKTEPFWPQAIQNIRAKDPNFLFLAEVYWDLEATLQEQGFDFTYDKHLYDRLQAQLARPVREHLFANMDFQSKSARFMENHDEPRAAKTFPLQVHRAAALITYLIPGMRFFHQGQLPGSKARIPMQLCRAPAEADDPKILDYYLRLLGILKLPILRDGEWRLLECHPAWQSNWTWDSYLAFTWEDQNNEHILVIVNYAPHQSQCYVRLPWQGLSGKQVCFRDIFGEAVYLRSWDDISQVGLYLDLPAWDFHVFEVTIT